MESIRSRLNKLNNFYLKKNLAKKNPIVSDLIDAYKKTIAHDRDTGMIGGSTLLSQNSVFKKILREEGINI